MARRNILAITGSIFLGVRIFDPARFDNFTECVLMVLNARGVDLRADAAFFGLIVLEGLLALAVVYASQKQLVLSLWLFLLTAQISANLFSLVSALDSNCGRGIFRDDPLVILGIHLLLLGLLLTALFRLPHRRSTEGIVHGK